jgi:hypothetical protein
LRKKGLTIIVLISVIILFPIAYLTFLNTAIPQNGIVFSAGLKDASFQTEYSEPGWYDSNFSQGWNINWTSTNSGLTVTGGVIDLYVAFNGYNPSQERGVSGIIIQKSIDHINTAIYPYLVIRHKESSSDQSLTFSFAIIDDKGGAHLGAWYHASTSWTNLEVNLTETYSGIVSRILIFFTNSFNPNYSGGVQHTYVQLIGLYGSPPTWTLASNTPVNATISSENSVLKVSANGDTETGTIISAQRVSGLDLDFTKYRYVNVSIMTSGIDVAARVVVWTDSSHLYPILLKTYNDKNWHIEIIDLSYFGIYSSSHLFMIGLGLLQISEGSNSTVCYSQLSFNSLEGV